MLTSYAHFLKIHTSGPILACQFVYYNRCHFYFEEFGEGDVEYQPFSGLFNACSFILLFIFFCFVLLF